MRLLSSAFSLACAMTICASAQAGLFHCHKCQPSCAAPTCAAPVAACCTPAPSCAAPSCAAPCHTCAPTCAAPVATCAPTCAAPVANCAPSCAAPCNTCAPSCAAPCNTCCKKSCCWHKVRWFRCCHRSKCCNTCGCSQPCGVGCCGTAYFPGAAAYMPVEAPVNQPAASIPAWTPSMKSASINEVPSPGTRIASMLKIW